MCNTGCGPIKSERTVFFQNVLRYSKVPIFNTNGSIYCYTDRSLFSIRENFKQQGKLLPTAPSNNRELQLPRKLTYSEGCSESGARTGRYSNVRKAAGGTDDCDAIGLVRAVYCHMRHYLN